MKSKLASFALLTVLAGGAAAGLAALLLLPGTLAFPAVEAASDPNCAGRCSAFDVGGR